MRRWTAALVFVLLGACAAEPEKPKAAPPCAHARVASFTGVRCGPAGCQRVHGTACLDCGAELASVATTD